MCNNYCISFAGAVVPVPLQLVPQGIESVNGSDVNMDVLVHQESLVV